MCTTVGRYTMYIVCRRLLKTHLFSWLAAGHFRCKRWAVWIELNWSWRPPHLVTVCFYSKFQMHLLFCTVWSNSLRSVYFTYGFCKNHTLCDCDCVIQPSRCHTPINSIWFWFWFWWTGLEYDYEHTYGWESRYVDELEL